MPEQGNRVPRFAAIGLIAGGALVYLGWELRLGMLTGESGGTLASPSAALLLVFIGVSCLLQLSPKTSFLRAGQAIGLTVASLSAAIAIGGLLKVDFGIDRILLVNRLGPGTALAAPGRTPFLTVLTFFLAGVGLVCSRIRPVERVADGCAALIAAVSYLGFVGYSYRLPPLYSGLIALPTAVLLGLAALALSTLRANSIVISQQAGGVVFRRVIAPLLVLMPLLGFLKLEAQQALSLSAEMATALLVVVTVFLFAGITAHTAGVVNAIDLGRRRAEGSLIRAEKLAAAGRLSATIAHEINNPLAAVMNLLYLARTTESPAKQSDYIGMAEDELRRAAEIAKRTLGFYREDSQPRDVQLGAVAQEVIELFRSRISASRIRLEADLPSTVRVHARAGEIRQIIANLIGNAIDAVERREDPRIEVAVSDSSGVAQLRVADNGCGIPAEQRNRIFEPFFTTKESVGTGLGLYLSRELAEKNGGFLQLASAAHSRQRGAIFCLTLPLASFREAVPAMEGPQSGAQGESR